MSSEDLRLAMQAMEEYVRIRQLLEQAEVAEAAFNSKWPQPIRDAAISLLTHLQENRASLPALPEPAKINANVRVVRDPITFDQEDDGEISEAELREDELLESELLSPVDSTDEQLAALSVIPKAQSGIRDISPESNSQQRSRTCYELVTQVLQEHGKATRKAPHLSQRDIMSLVEAKAKQLKTAMHSAASVYAALHRGVKEGVVERRQDEKIGLWTYASTSVVQGNRRGRLSA